MDKTSLMYNVIIEVEGRRVMEKKALNIAVGERIRTMRETNRFTREQLAEKANISTQFLYDIENGAKSMTVPTIINIATALHVSTDYLLLGNNKNIPVDTSIIAQLQTLSENQQKIAGELLSCFVRGMTAD